MKHFLQHNKILWLTLLFLFFIGNLMGTASAAREISHRFVRFHIIANSNTNSDQSVKWKVREAIFSRLELESITSKDAALRYFCDQQETIETIANMVLAENGFSYTAKVRVEKRNFPVREYSDFVLPAGVYDSVCVTLGEGKGENFFCVMYPSLCKIEGITEKTESNPEVLKAVLSEKEAALITGNKKQIICRFKIAELWNKIF